MHVGLIHEFYILPVVSVLFVLEKDSLFPFLEATRTNAVIMMIIEITPPIAGPRDAASCFSLSLFTFFLSSLQP